MTPAVSTSRLSKIYSRAFSKRKIHALQDLTLEIESGEIFGLLGPNGAGKTTLLKLLLGIAHPTSGQASLFGNSISLPNSRVSIGFLPENHRFPPFLTAAQSLRVYGRLSNLDRSDISYRTDQLLEQVGLREWTNVRISEYSKGMMQRLGLAQALLGSPDLLLLDEPTDGVDPLGRRHIRDLLLSLRHEGMTIFLNSHLLSEVELVCTRVAILHKGCLVKSGSIKELTGQTNQYRFLFSAKDREKLSAAFPDRPLLPAIESDERLVIEIKAETPLVLNAEIDVFRAKELDILGIVPDYRSLESRFMEIIETLGGEDL